MPVIYEYCNIWFWYQVTAYRFHYFYLYSYIIFSNGKVILKITDIQVTDLKYELLQVHFQNELTRVHQI